MTTITAGMFVTFTDPRTPSGFSGRQFTQGVVASVDPDGINALINVHDVEWKPVLWPADRGTESPNVQASRMIASEHQTVTPAKFDLFTAVALAGGVGGRVLQDGVTFYDIRRADSEASGTVALQAASGGYLHEALSYSSFCDPAWTPVLTEGAAAGDAPKPPATVIPRTADEAHRMLALVRDTADSDVVAALRQLRLFLPGGKAEREAAEMADRIRLCPAYEGVVCSVLGWCPRPRNESEYRREVSEFGHTLVKHETDYADISPSTSLVRFAEYYAPGGVANEAIIEHMRDNLERDKWEAANEMLTALGMHPIDTPQNYAVTVRVQRTVTAYQYVTVNVTAEDEDAASDHAIDDYHLLANATDAYGWSFEDGYLTTDSHDIDDAEVSEVYAD